MKTKFLSVSLGITMMLMAAGFLIRSINVANAVPSPVKFLEQGTSKIGKYQASICVKGDGESAYALIMDTETGATAYYYCSNGWYKSAAQLPVNHFAK